MPTPVTPSQITALMTGFRKEFQNGLAMAPSHYQQVATSVPSTSTSKSNTYGWLGQFPAFREWVGARSIQQMKVYGYTINNKTYEGTVAITGDDFEDDNLGVYTPLFQEMGRAAAAQPDELVFTALRDGNKTDCYDGKPFFDSEHPVYPKVDGTGTAKKVANQLIEKTGSGATEKDYAGAVWYLLDCSRALKPLIFQNRRPPELLALTKVDEGRAFTDNEFVFGASARRNVGYGFWQMAYRMQASLTLDNLWKGWSAMRGFTADGGRKLGIRPTHLVVPVELEKTATQLLERELLAEGSTTVSNEMKGKLTLLVADAL